MNVPNYQRKLDRILDRLEGRPTLLLHSCCGPCSTYVLEYTMQHFDVTLLFYDPNIQPEEEYRKRLFYQKKVLERFPAKLMECGYDGEAFERAAAGLEVQPEGGLRCRACFALRLDATARLAAANGFEYFSTTLTVSPYKDEQLINPIGMALGEKYGVKWLPSDFKKRGGFDRSTELSQELELYRQDWCGCRFSHEDHMKKTGKA